MYHFRETIDAEDGRSVPVLIRAPELQDFQLSSSPITAPNPIIADVYAIDASLEKVGTAQEHMNISGVRYGP